MRVDGLGGGEENIRSTDINSAEAGVSSIGDMSMQCLIGLVGGLILFRAIVADFTAMPM